MKDQLRAKGFNAENIGEDTFVSLNRPVSLLEIEIALDFEVTREHMIRTAKGIIIINQVTS